MPTSVPPRCDRTEAWAELRRHFDHQGRRFDVRAAFAEDPRRFAAFSLEAPEVFADLSKNLVDADTLALLLALARECRIEARRDAMLAGESINHTEGRAVLHTALRAPRGAAPHTAQVHDVLDAMLAYAERVRDTASSGIRDVVHIGIGGSDLGPQMTVMALQERAQPSIRSHFVSNVDAHDITRVLRQL
ncbi:MAG TPA: glucose-6-phosphate isomerase, partial [Burkholderiaceae bacterium]|nr:glucose-6-phosphate isomerase [Burkholderiaceae bacterium]